MIGRDQFDLDYHFTFCSTDDTRICYRAETFYKCVHSRFDDGDDFDGCLSVYIA